MTDRISPSEAHHVREDKCQIPAKIRVPRHAGTIFRHSFFDSDSSFCTVLRVLKYNSVPVPPAMRKCMEPLGLTITCNRRDEESWDES